MKIITKCKNCEISVSIAESEIKKKVKKDIQHKKGQQKFMVSSYNTYYYKKDYYGKYIPCPCCKNKIWITRHHVLHDDLEAKAY